MNTHDDKTQQDKNQSVASAAVQKQSGSKSTFQFVDNRPEALAQRKRQEMANNSAQAKQAAQLQAMARNYSAQQQRPIQKKENNTGLPDQLKSGIENLSGHSMDDVKVHYNSSKPAQLQAHAYAQGTDIHLASGQEKHLPHEAWHVVQQKQVRVKPTMQMKGKVNLNDDVGLEKEADVMGVKALQMKPLMKKKEVNFSSNAPNRITQLSGRPQRLSARRQYGDRSRYGRLRFSSASLPSSIRGLGLVLRRQYRRHHGRTAGSLSHYVYIGTQRGVGIYVGITNNPPRRQHGHGARFHLHVLNRGNPLSRIEVRGIEQALINMGRGSMLNQNIAESISAIHPYYDTAVRFGERFWNWARRTNRDLLRFI